MTDSTQQYIDEWLRGPVRRLKPTTQLQYANLIEDLPTAAPTLEDLRSKTLRRHFRAMVETPVKANRWKAVVSSFCAWLVEEELLEYNPAIGIRKNSEKPKTRFMTAQDLMEFAGAMEHCRTSPYSLACVRVLLSTGCRLSEALGMTWEEIQMQPDGSAEWHVPETRTKSARPLVTRLPARLVLELRCLDSFNLRGRKGRVFWSPASPTMPLSMRSVYQAMERLCLRAEITRFSPHDLRRTVGTQLARLGIHVEVRKALLNHAPSGVTNIHYNQYDYWPEKVAALQQMEQLLIETNILPSVGRQEHLLAS